MPSHPLATGRLGRPLRHLHFHLHLFLLPHLSDTDKSCNMDWTLRYQTTIVGNRYPTVEVSVHICTPAVGLPPYCRLILSLILISVVMMRGSLEGGS
ncbi:hypothetical protein F5B22DRAFT_616524 [Xylaria bambusicola]|uniref:uncharacterized protein n=1 Tax=Xylaria bambusicola TaxID=326684 RepID=UPI002008DA18|nr:uncharacterized protein F5B22DRAFT_616524 [Xylaria bambusicola]KAI0509494.1 hypothetical protein F5B22DRAFT_616524 [Xylaria bambusicola]